MTSRTTVDAAHAPVSDAIERALAALGVPLAVAEAHGLACGLLSSQRASAAKARWFAELLDAGGGTPEAIGATLARNGAAARELDAWFQSTDQALNSSELSFEPALPEDEEPLARRFDALASFCAGFTYGLGLGSAKRGNAPLPDDVREVVRDLQAIEGADARGSDGELADEGDYAELVEYVRVGVLVVLEELRPVAPREGTVPDIPSDGSAGALH